MSGERRKTELAGRDFRLSGGRSQYDARRSPVGLLPRRWFAADTHRPRPILVSRAPDRDSRPPTDRGPICARSDSSSSVSWSATGLRFLASGQEVLRVVEHRGERDVDPGASRNPGSDARIGIRTGELHRGGRVAHPPRPPGHQIVLGRDTIVSLTQATGLIPPRRRGRKTNALTLFRWSTTGCRGIIMPTIQCGGTRCTSVEAIQWFFEALTDLSRTAAARPRPGYPTSSQPVPAPAGVRGGWQATRADGRVEDERLSSTALPAPGMHYRRSSPSAARYRAWRRGEPGRSSHGPAVTGQHTALESPRSIRRFDVALLGKADRGIGGVPGNGSGSPPSRLAWIPMQKRKPNGIAGFSRFSRGNRPSGAGFSLHLYTEFHSSSNPIQSRLLFRFPRFSRDFRDTAVLPLTNLSRSDIWGLCLPVNPKN